MDICVGGVPDDDRDLDCMATSCLRIDGFLHHNDADLHTVLDGDDCQGCGRPHCGIANLGGLVVSAPPVLEWDGWYTP